jgi:hypothetical protein
MHGREAETYFISLLDANRNFYKQLMVGDSTDNIQGIPRVGKKNKALLEIDKLTDEREMAEFAFNQYLNYEIKAYDKDQDVCVADSDDDDILMKLKGIAYNKYLENGRLIWIRRVEGELWEPPQKEG